MGWAVSLRAGSAYSIRGTVLDSSGAPIADADVTLECPESAPPHYEETGRTSASGEFEFSGIGCVPSGCRVRTEAVDGGEVSDPIGAHCTARSSICPKDACNAARINVQAK